MAKVLASLFTSGVKSGEVKWSIYGHLVLPTVTAFPVCQVFWNLVSTSACPASSQVLGSGASESVTPCWRAWPGCVWTCWRIWDSAGMFLGPGIRVQEPGGSCLSTPARHDVEPERCFLSSRQFTCKGIRVGLSVFCVNTEEQVKKCFYYECVLRNCQCF